MNNDTMTKAITREETVKKIANLSNRLALPPIPIDLPSNAFYDRAKTWLMGYDKLQFFPNWSTGTVMVLGFHDGLADLLRFFPLISGYVNSENRSVRIARYEVSKDVENAGDFGPLYDAICEQMIDKLGAL